MKSTRWVTGAVAAGVFAALSATAVAGTTTTASSKLVSTYTPFAGSQTNAEALVDGLSDGSAITLETTTSVKNTNGTVSTVTTPTTFQPATGKLGTGNVNIALALAENQLSGMGITDPTGAEIEAALNGGTVVLADGSSQNLQGVLALRAEGQGWGQIANTLGFKLGDVVSASKTDHSNAGATHGQNGPDVASANRPQHPDHPQRPDVANRPMAPEHPMMPQRPDIPDRGGRPGGH